MDLFENTEVCSFEKTRREKLVVSLSTFKDKTFVDIRTFVRRPDGDFIPTRKGVNWPVENIEELRFALGHAKEMAYGLCSGAGIEERKAG